MKVLVAEGNEDSRNLLVKQLQGYGHEVIAVANGAEALEQALKEKPDILVTDILMPHMDGFMLCHLWKKIEQLWHVPFIFYTSSYTFDKDRQFALSLGANAFVSKPTDPERLVRVMVEAYEKAKSGLLSSPEVAALEPSQYFTEYSKRLSTMLDKKVAQLEREVTERKRAEEALSRSEEEKSLILSSLSELVAYQDKQLRVIWVNKAAAESVGLAVEQLVGRHCYEIWSQRTEPCIGCPVTRVLKTGRTQEAEMTTPDGRVWSIRGSPVKDESGDVIGAVEVTMEITERKKAEEALRDGEVKYHTIFSESRDGIVLVDAETGFIRDCNPEFERQTGRKLKQLKKMHIWEIRPIDKVEDAKRKFLEVSEKRGGEARDLEFQRPNGEIVPIEFKSKAVEILGRRYLQSISRDITERKRVEGELRESEERYRTVFNTASASIILIDSEGQMVDVSPYHINKVGRGKITEEDLVGKNILTHPTIVNAGLSETYRRVLEGEPFDKKDVYFPTLIAGGDGYFNVKGMPLFQDEQVIGAVITHEDITERKRMEGERERAARRAEALRDVAQAVNRSLELDELLNEALATVLHIMETDSGGIYLLDLQSGEFTLKAHIGFSEDTVASIGLIKLNGKEIKRVLEWQEPSLTPLNLSSGANATRMAAAIKKGEIRAHVTMPIWSRDVLVGALLLANRCERQLRADDVELLRDIGNELAVGITNALLLQRTKELSLTDELTGLYNRRHLYHVLEPEMYRTLRKGRSFSLVILDLDGFKEYNDRMGHARGDSVLQAFAQTIDSSLRKSDTAFRYGGDEFIIILPETDANRARQVMGRIRARWLKLVEAQYAPLETPLGFCAGIAQFPENADTADGLVFLADSALYYAKKEGGGRDILVSSLSTIPPELLGTATLDQVYALAATVDARDPYTYGHSGRVADIAQRIGKARGLSEKELANLYAASLLHDVGKVGVPDAILTKPGALTAEEWVAIKKHSAEGARIVGYVRGLGALVPVILHHHEWYDGTGYPDGLRGEDIPLAARIISVADAYDTMTTARPYREVVSRQEAVEELRRCSGTQFDPELVEAFCRAINEDSGQGKKRKPASE